MSIELKIPALGESITEAQIGQWLKTEGQPVAEGENIVTLESEKATLELPSPASGSLGKILKQTGETAAVGSVIAVLEQSVDKPSDAGKPAAPTAEAPPEPKPETAPKPAEQKEPTAHTGNGHSRKPEEVKETESVESQSQQQKPSTPKPAPAESPVTEYGEEPPPPRLSPEQLSHPIGQKRATEPPPVSKDKEAKDQPVRGNRAEQVVPMSPLRRALSRRLLEAQHSAALLTTVNEIDMTEILELRKRHGEVFREKYGVKLGLMSFFTKAAIEGLKLVPVLNASIRGTDIVYHNYYDIGIAIAGGKGLVVPLLRNAERLSFGEIEKAIADFAERARTSGLKPDELEGGTFTITNGGVYGSLLSTPIVNPPQSGILGLHAIKERPVAVNGNVVIRPMMYVALTYDHRIVDGREAVTCLRRIKEIIEDPARMLIEA